MKSLKNLGYLDLCDLQDYTSLSKPQKQILTMLQGYAGMQLKNVLWQNLWRFDLKDLTATGVYLAGNEKYDFAELMNCAIEIKTLEYITRKWNFNWN